MSKICLRCNNFSNDFIRIVSIDENGQTMGNVLVCSDCRIEWGKIFVKDVTSVSGKNFYKSWAIAWKKFMSDRGKEVVQFT